MRTTIAAIIVASTAIAATAHAQVQTGPGFFGYLDGMYHLDPGRSSGVRFADVPGANAKTNVGDGWGVGGRLGWRFDGAWDIALAGRYSNFSAGKSANDALAMRLTDGQVWNVDLEAGYTLLRSGWAVRPSLGLRFLRYRHTFGVPGFTGSDRSWGLGPHVGVDGALRLSESFSLIGGIDTAFLFGRSSGSTNGGLFRDKDARFIWQIGGKIGVDWELAPLVHLAAGYRVLFNNGIRSQSFVDSANNFNPHGRSGLLEHGPYIRLAYNWGAPPLGVAAAPPPPPPVTPAQYIVFFDFDRATLSAQAVTTIRQAAAAARAGNRTRIGVTGHADRAGSDAYNIALSLRRANAVKDQLVQEGIPATNIAVVGRGESQPLVPTADGVREPQNRRVEIVLN